MPLHQQRTKPGWRWAAMVAACACTTIAGTARGYTWTQNLTYESPGNFFNSNRFDLFTPNGGIVAGAPTVIDLHGGGYTVGDKGLEEHVCGALADRGFNVITMNYSLAYFGQSSFPQTFRDVRAMIRWVRTTGVQMGLSPTIIMTGQSAGATIAVAAAYAPDTPEFDPPLPPPPGGYAVDAVVGLYGRYDLVWDAQTFGSPVSIMNYLGLAYADPGGPARYAAAAAATYVGPCTPPTKLLVGDSDGVVPPGNSIRLAAALNAAGVYRILHVLPGVGHGDGILQDWSFVSGEISSAIPVLLGARNPACGSAPVAPGNDNCEVAFEILAGQSVVGSSYGATMDATGVCGHDDTRDVWYHFVAPEALGYTFDTGGTTGMADTTLAVFSDCPPGNTLLGCDDDSYGESGGRLSQVSVSLQAGQGVSVRVAGNGGTMGYFRLNVDLGQVLYPSPNNDDCADAFDATMGTFVVSTLGAAGRGSGSCGHGDDKDVWFRFVVPMSARYRFDTAGPGDLPQHSISLSGSCSGPNLGCDDYEQGGPAPRVDVTLAAGQVVFIRIAGDDHATGSLVLTIGRVPGPTGGCCISTDCTTTDSYGCASGMFFANQPCEASPCQPIGQPPGACCIGPRCTMTDGAAFCGGTFLGVSVVCGQPGNPTTCCDANFNRFGGVSVQDIFDFLAAYFAGDTHADFNTSGEVTVQDIFDFLAAYFRGC